MIRHATPENPYPPLVSLPFITSLLHAQTRIDTIMPVRRFLIAAPKPQDLDEFVKFIETELASRNVNTLLLRVDYRYKYKSQPELR